MSRHVPLLVEVVLRAWGTDDPRVVSSLAAENQPGIHQRTNAVGERARDAGGPVLTTPERYKAAAAAIRRLEPADLTPHGLRDRYHQKVAAAQTSRSQVQVRVDHDPPTDDNGDPMSIYDE
jgi:hypothetical protein